MKKPLTTNEREALQRLCTIATGDSGQCRRVATFLLAWHNADENGKWDPRDLWALDTSIQEDVLMALSIINNHRSYPGELGFEDQIKRIWHLWRSNQRPGACPECGRT